MRGAPWQVLHVRANAERRVAQSLLVREIEAYLPLYSERVKWTDRTVTTERPLFPGYVFARFSSGSRISVISTPGIVRYLGDEPQDLVSSNDLERIQAALISGYLLRPHPVLTAGMRVRVRDGAFEGVEGVVMELRQQCKVVIALAPVRQCFSLELSLESLEIID